MSEGKTGGPAFPTRVATGATYNDATGALHYEYETRGGLTVRDFFAAHALAGMLVRYAGYEVTDTKFARWSYDLADAMIAHRNKDTPND